MVMKRGGQDTIRISH